MEVRDIVALVGGEAKQVACVPQSDLLADVCPVWPLRTAMDVDTAQGAVIDEKRGLYRLNLTITPFQVVIRRLSTVEVGSVNSSSRQIRIGTRSNDLQSADDRESPRVEVREWLALAPSLRPNRGLRRRSLPCEHGKNAG